MKNLYLVRHAKSSWKDGVLPDFDRPLNKRGSLNAPFMATLLEEMGVKPELLISSPAKRAIITARTFAGKFNYPLKQIATFESIYDGDMKDLLQVINTIPDLHDNIMFFGHNPAITLLSNYISDKRIDSIPTCGVVHIKINVKSWADVDYECGNLIFFEYPKKYKDKL